MKAYALVSLFLTIFGCLVCLIEARDKGRAAWTDSQAVIARTFALVVGVGLAFAWVLVWRS